MRREWHWKMLMAMSPQKFGGPWSLIKVDTVARYYSAFTTALKKQPFKLVCIDAFAGSGHFQFSPMDASPLFDEDKVVQTHAGSARRALSTQPPFDRLIFIENEARNVAALTAAARDFPKADVDIRRGDANVEVEKLGKEIVWRATRGVIFLDPFGHSVEWSTIAQLGKTKLDVWYLFPLSGLYRNVPIDRNDLTPDKKAAVTRILGTDQWEADFYEAPPPQPDLLTGLEDAKPTGPAGAKRRSADVDVMENFVKSRLESVFPLVLRPKRLLGPTNAPLYSLFFAMANDSQSAQRVARPIAQHLLDHI
jgi:three-Cys-motif partner protein